ncbi:MAG: tRNA (adenosine(37)-N6)-dimethylallyltransferase MiaA [Paracoccaceae bacterium]|nr:tRNA (adenosine(37)-N6)-dimethylallyltransferase MiaA [Paracoccaceae bacterium]
MKEIGQRFNRPRHEYGSARRCAALGTSRTADKNLKNINNIDPEKHVLIAGPTASGKSALALEIASRQGGTIVNADALQVWACWRILTARPAPADEAAAPHKLYGHVAPGTDYSVGKWLAEVASIRASGARLIVTGGTGLYFAALTEGLAEIPPVPPDIRRKSAERLADGGIGALLDTLDSETLARIDQRNPVRVQRAWEVLQATGRGLADWQGETPAPLLPISDTTALVIEADRDWLADRINRRFDAMIGTGALDEVRAVLPIWDAGALWAKAIGAPELVTHLTGALPLAEAVTAAKAATRQYAKRQRSWFRGRMSAWVPWPAR